MVKSILNQGVKIKEKLNKRQLQKLNEYFVEEHFMYVSCVFENRCRIFIFLFINAEHVSAVDIHFNLNISSFFYFEFFFSSFLGVSIKSFVPVICY